MSKKNRIRIFINQPLEKGSEIDCSETKMHYLKDVMRLDIGDDVFLFNGVDGEFKSIITEMSRKKCVLTVEEQIYPFQKCPDIWLLYAPLKKESTDFLIAKAVELGVVKIIPVLTDYTISAGIRPDRITRQIEEAAEQCRRLDIPVFAPAMPIRELLAKWPHERILFYLDETGSAPDPQKALMGTKMPAAMLVGPEGGFSEKELEILRKMSYTRGISLGKRILRAETAAVAALACWQSQCGDWRTEGK